MASDLVPPAGVEPATWWVEATRSIQLSYGGKSRTKSVPFPVPRPLTVPACPCVVSGDKDRLRGEAYRWLLPSCSCAMLKGPWWP